MAVLFSLSFCAFRFKLSTESKKKNNQLFLERCSIGVITISMIRSGSVLK